MSKPRERLTKAAVLEQVKSIRSKVIVYTLMTNTELLAAYQQEFPDPKAASAAWSTRRKAA
jgi:hypothetical protein